jgi:hypothetical protein
MNIRLFCFVRLNLVLPDPAFHRRLVSAFDDYVTVLCTAVFPGLENGAGWLRRLFSEGLEHPLGRRLVCFLRGTLDYVHQHTFTPNFVMGCESLDCAGGKCLQKLVLLTEFHSVLAVPFIVGGVVGRDKRP